MLVGHVTILTLAHDVNVPPLAQMYREFLNFKRAYLPNETWYKAEICKLAYSCRVLTVDQDAGRKFNGRGVVLESPY